MLNFVIQKVGIDRKSYSQMTIDNQSLIPGN